MPQSRPLWLALVAAPFLGYFCLLVSLDIARPEDPGMVYQHGTNPFVIGTVTPGSAADRAGLKAGDDVVTIDGHPISSRIDIEARDINLELNKARDVMVVRDGFVRHLPLTIGRPPARYLRSKQELVLLLVRGMLLSTLLLGIFIAWKRPRDHVALVAAGLLATVGVFSITLPYRMAVFWRDLPPALGALLWIPFLSTACVGAWLFALFTVFPYRRFRSPWLWVVSMGPMAAVLLPYAAESWRAVYRPDDLDGMRLWPYATLLGVNLAYIAASLVMLVIKYRQLATLNERRRVRVLLIGSVTGWVAGAPVGITYWRGDANLTHSLFGSNAMVFGAMLFLIFPISFGYAVLRHRLFDVSVIVRMGLRYALARRALLSLVPLLGIVLAADLLIHGRQPLTQILVARAVIYLAIASLAGVAYVYRRRWLDNLDRRFFRERYDARQILSRLVTDVRQVGSFHGVAERVTAAIESTLHAEFAAMVVRRGDDTQYRTVAVTPAGHALAPWPADSRLMQLARVLGKPVQGGGSSGDWLQKQLPPDEAARLRDMRAECLVPIGPRAADPQRLAAVDAILLLGAKRSEEPYGSEDIDLLAAIAESLAMLLDREAAPTQSAIEFFDECPSCGACYDSGSGHCPHEGARLLSGRVPRLLVDRYRIERRLGRGGMGTVYAALDTTLDRPVAVKVVRDELVGREEARSRFHAEARSAAKFAHPNVVTIHDFGVTADGVGYLVMERLEGVTLRQELQQQGRLPPAQVCAVLRDASAAVDAAHRHQLIHRDLKPENVFLVRAGAGSTAKVLDFGLAKYASAGSIETPTTQQTHPGMLIGTPAYMSPEQLRGGDPSPSWDLWALTLMAYETLAGRHPFAGRHVSALPGGINGYNEMISAPLTDASPACRAFFLRALALDLESRPQSARELADDFQRAME